MGALEYLDAKCVVCKTMLVRERVNTRVSPPIIGARATTISHIELRCPRCGLMYKHVPHVSSVKGDD